MHCSHVWFPTVQEVLHADWHDVWHSPHPPFLIVFCNFLVFNVFTCFIKNLSFSSSIDGTLKSAYLLYYITALPIWKGFFEKSSRSKKCKFSIKVFLIFFNFSNVHNFLSVYIVFMNKSEITGEMLHRYPFE